MISELQFMNKTLDQSGLKISEKYYSQYEEYLKIFNNMSGEKILEFIYQGQVIIKLYVRQNIPTNNY